MSATAEDSAFGIPQLYQQPEFAVRAHPHPRLQGLGEGASRRPQRGGVRQASHRAVRAFRLRWKGLLPRGVGMVACGIWRSKRRLVAVVGDDDGRAAPALTAATDDDERWGLLESLDAEQFRANRIFERWKGGKE